MTTRYADGKDPELAAIGQRYFPGMSWHVHHDGTASGGAGTLVVWIMPNGKWWTAKAAIGVHVAAHHAAETPEEALRTMRDTLSLWQADLNLALTFA